MKFIGEEIIKKVKLEKLHPFPDHPFQVRDDESMQETVESVKQYGVLSPILVREREEGGYEIISGHRRKRACELAGIEDVPVIVRNMDRDSAIIAMVDANIQREYILPSEKAAAYRMKYEAIKRQGARIVLPLDSISKFFPKNYKPHDMERMIYKLLESWQKKKQKQHGER